MDNLLNEARVIYGDEFASGVEAIRRYRAFESEEDAIYDLLEDLFLTRFDAIQRHAADTDDLELHRHIWRIHDAFVGAPALVDMMAAYVRLVRAERRIHANRSPL